MAFRILCLYFTTLLIPDVQAQTLNKYWVEFLDKQNSPYCVCRPAEFLSARALDRRARAGIALEENDLPVNPQYLDSLRNVGAVIHTTSRWLNAATVIADTATATLLSRFEFVKKVQYVGPDIPARNPPDQPAKKRRSYQEYPSAGGSEWGYAGRQNAFLGMPLLYWAGARGKDIWVAVMDGGFTNVDTLPFFDSIAVAGRLFQGRDFVERDGSVFESAMHGTSVLSVMAANLPGYFVGTAPEATYFLIKTEDTGGEFPVEECNWIAGAEWADSIGVDIINASLGYTVFNDTTLGHRFWELDGRTSIGARGASIAARKGMIICNSAGNSGDEPWRHVGVPADAPGIIAVGACSFDGARASFSSVGPTADGRVKPDLMAPGEMIVTAGNEHFDLALSNGTSLAAPMLTGALAGLWSAFPEKTAQEILDAVYASSDQNLEPDNNRGYGLPDFSLAWLRLSGYYDFGPQRAGENTLFRFDRITGILSFLCLDFPEGEEVIIRILDIGGRNVLFQSVKVGTGVVKQLDITGLSALPPGAYRISVQSKTDVWNWQAFIDR